MTCTLCFVSRTPLSATPRCLHTVIITVAVAVFSSAVQQQQQHLMVVLMALTVNVGIVDYPVYIDPLINMSNKRVRRRIYTATDALTVQLHASVLLLCASSP